MFQIYKLRADHVIDFAAEELKKYLRMMMPRAGDAAIGYDHAATTGFRLGLLEDFGLPNEAEDPVLDDIVHIEADREGGILAGSNPRSVLFAVYRFFKENGARWLYPGIDGEYIPIKDIQPVNYHHMADHRFRGQCNEGAESQQCMIETIDFYAKLEMNVYMMEFDIPLYYYDVYYSHKYNEQNRPPEPVSKEQVLQWKRVCEAEIAKRGLQFHDMGHGWTAEPFGLNSSKGWNAEEQEIPAEVRPYLAEINGKRALHRGLPLNTNLCMSSPEVQKILAKGVADYAERHPNVDYIHVWLADGLRNHCECAECCKMRPADFYMQIMNEIDAQLTARALRSRIVFIAYVDTLWGPERITIQNPRRFSLLYAPSYRSYSESLRPDAALPEIPPFERNRWQVPTAVELNMALLQFWKRNWKGPCFGYEYHFWIHQYYDVGGIYMARRIAEDIKVLQQNGINGLVEDGSQRSAFPHGLAMVAFAEGLLHRDCDFEALKADYFRHIYGECAEEAEQYLEKMSAAFDFSWLEGERSRQPERSKYYAPEMAGKLEAVPAIAAEGRALAMANLVMPTRPQTVSMRLLLRHAEYCERIAVFMREKALGNDERARELGYQFFDDFGRYEWEIERYFDHGLAMKAWREIIKKPKSLNLQMEG